MNIAEYFEPTLDKYVDKFKREGTSMAILHAVLFGVIVYVIVDQKVGKK